MRRRRRRTRPVSQATLDQRLKDIWIDGFGLMPTLPGKAVERLRLSLRKLVDDEDYWEGLNKLAALKQEVEQCRMRLKK